MAVGERDPFTGHMTTGHEWNGIKELNTPVPRPVYFFLIVTALFSLGYWILMPAWPLGATFTKGLLGVDQRATVDAKLAAAAAERAPWTTRIEGASYDEIEADPALMKTVREVGGTLFADNCAVCHGVGGKGGKGYPSLAGSTWLWGGSPEAIAETIRVGINAAHPDTRVSQMLAFGRDQMLPRADIEKVVAYVRSLSAKEAPAAGDVATIAAGSELFAANCASCHGDDAKGKTDVGAPNLTDDFSIYGGDRQSVFTTVYGGRQGQMPSWEARLPAVDRKVLTLYVRDLGRAAP